MASGEKRPRRKLPAGGPAEIPGIVAPVADAAPATLPGLPGAAALPRSIARKSVKPVKTAAPVAAAHDAAPAVAEAVETTTSQAQAVADTVAEQAETVTGQVAGQAEAVTGQIAEQAETAAGQVAEAAEQQAGTVEAVADTVVETQAALADTVEDAATQAVDTGIAVARAAAPIIEDAAPAAPAKQETTIMDTIQNTTEKTQAFFADANERAKGTMEKGARLFQEMTEFSKGNVEAVVESSKIAARGLETMGQDTAAYLKTSFEEASQALRTLATIKSPAELMKFQADYVRASFDALVAQTSRGTEASLKLAGEVAQPISNRVAVAAEKIKVAA